MSAIVYSQSYGILPCDSTTTSAVLSDIFVGFEFDLSGLFVPIHIPIITIANIMIPEIIPFLIFSPPIFLFSLLVTIVIKKSYNFSKNVLIFCNINCNFLLT